MSDLRKAIKQLNMIIKLILTFFFDPIIGGIYRICGGDVKGIVIGIIWLVTGGLFGIGWIIDIVTVILKNDYTVLA
ncbi:MAG: hypothetical protein K6F14_07375 [Clostridiales bacterium]|nr:hypothetical protein [Clostridiales bacterium]